MRNNLNLIRLLLAIGVIFDHSYPLTGNHNNPLSFFTDQFSIGRLAVYSFFCISGFLITKSYLTSNNLKVFLWHRFLRIYPALWFAIMISVCLGFFAQHVYGVIDFIRNPMTTQFVLVNAVLNDVKFFLPSVFNLNPYKDAVNGSLWTLPLEMRMYVLIALVGVLGIIKSKLNFNALFCVIFLLGFNYKYPIFDNLDPDSTKVCAFFLLGAVLYVNEVKFQLRYFIVSLVIAYLCFQGKLSLVWFLFAWSYIILYICFVPNLFQKYFNKIGDYSYGTYVYAFPIQQFLMFFFMSNYNRLLSHNQLFLLSLAVTLAISFISWHLLEKQCLKFKNIFSLNK